MYHIFAKGVDRTNKMAGGGGGGGGVCIERLVCPNRPFSILTLSHTVFSVF